MADFYQLTKATALRRKGATRSPDYHSKLWRFYEPSHHVKLFLAEYEDEPISGLLTVPFGNTVVAELFGWSGEKSRCRPNDLLFWNALEWSKDNGYEIFDLGGVDISVAQALQNKNPPPEGTNWGPTRFKLGFGGSLKLLPPTVEYVSSRAFRQILRYSSLILGKDYFRVVLPQVLSADDRGGFLPLLFKHGK